MGAGGIRVVAREIHRALVGSEWESPPLAHRTVWAVFVAAWRKGAPNGCRWDPIGVVPRLLQLWAVPRLLKLEAVSKVLQLQATPELFKPWDVPRLQKSAAKVLEITG